ncbi:hypothetical protein HMPREF9996_01586 [Aggregatibacter actinomycetemcomitans Y4]|nr:hypothetical protein CF65_02778 [Aggregatibacter actinomycetemcomitans HK1651]EKX95282.1 hypothetical protein HMPREF9996_01586 [Aggregatibacter actinomycetemcomitans Y4]
MLNAQNRSLFSRYAYNIIFTFQQICGILGDGFFISYGRFTASLYFH